MFFGSRNRQKRTSAPHSSESSGDELEAHHWRLWQRSAQKVTRLWNEWQAANGRDREELYRRYVAALAEEEQAAAQLERMLKSRGKTHMSTLRVAHLPASGAAGT